MSITVERIPAPFKLGDLVEDRYGGSVRGVVSAIVRATNGIGAPFWWITVDDDAGEPLGADARDFRLIDFVVVDRVRA